MNNQQKQQLAKLYSGLAVAYNRQITNESIILMVNALQDLNFESVFQTMNEWIATEVQFPLPALIRAKIKPVLNDLDDGREIASRVIQAISKFGSYNPLEAKNYIGEVGWECVSRFGGWNNLCSELNQENQNIMNAQLRDIAMTLMKRSKTGVLEDRINFPKPKNEIQNLVSKTFKLEMK